MKKHITKRLLGAAGLLIVGAMTAFAASIPGPQVQAVDETELGTTDLSVTIVESPVSSGEAGFSENGDPMIRVGFDDTICSIKVQATNIATGDTLFDPIFSQEIGVPRPADNSIVITLPFAERGAVAGDYSLAIYGYSCSSPEKSMGGALMSINYTGSSPVVPNTANTGDLNVLGVNLARADFIAMGALIVAVATVCLILFLRKKHHK